MPRLTTTTLIAFALLLAAPAAEAANPVLGIADQKQSTFTSPRFKSLHVQRSRYVVPWNVALVRSERARFNAWYRAARKAGVKQVMVAFSASRGSRCPARPCSLPSARSYTRAFRAFRHHYTVNMDAPFLHPSLNGYALRALLGQIVGPVAQPHAAAS